jgi:hypothetical protein
MIVLARVSVRPHNLGRLEIRLGTFTTGPSLL